MPIELDIAGNFAKGANVRHTARRARQVEQAIDLELGDAKDKQASRRNLYGLYEQSQGRTPSFVDHQGLEDPFAFKMMDWWKQRRAARQQPVLSAPGSSVPTPEGMMGQGVLPLEEIPGYADGSPGGVQVPKQRTPRPPDVPQARAAQARAQTPARVGSTTVRVPPAAPPAPKASGWLSKALRFGGRAAGRAFTTAVPLVAAGIEALTPHTLGSGELSAEQKAEQEALGAASQADQTTPEPAPVAAPEQALALGAEAAKTPLPQADQQVPVEGGFDWSTVDAMPDEMPNMSVRDWADYRSRAVGEMMRGGMGEAQANDEITKMQHSGFMSLGQEALTLLQAGDMQNAAKALKAAYQYFPNGADVSFGIQGNNLIGMGKSETDGKPVGKPMILDGERLSVMLENFAKPETFRVWTKDQRDEARQERTYNEVTRPAAEATARAGQTNAQANLLDAQSNAAYRAGGGARGADPGPDDRRAMEAIYREELAAMGMTDAALSEDPTGLPRLASIASQIRAQIPDTQQLPDNELLELVMSHHRAGTLDGIVQQFGLE